MKTIFVVNVNGSLKNEDRTRLRKIVMKELEEGLLVIDDSFSVTTFNIQGEVGLEFNKEEEQ